MTCVQLWTKTRNPISRKICHVRLGFQNLYAVEQCFHYFQGNLPYAVELSSNYFS